MDTNTLLKEVRENLLDADLSQLEVWYSQLASLYAWIAQNLGDVKKDRAIDEIAIHKRLLEAQSSDSEDKEDYRIKMPTQKEIEREYYASEKGQYLAMNTEYAKAVSSLKAAVKFRIENLRNI